jgi:hypothetical protein
MVTFCEPVGKRRGRAGHAEAWELLMVVMALLGQNRLSAAKAARASKRLRHD